MNTNNLDHHSPSYTGIESSYNGIDYNDYLIEEALKDMNL